MSYFRSSSGFTLVEVLLSVTFLGLLAGAVSTVYFMGFQTMDEQNDRMLLDSKLRSRMEVLVGTAFGALSNGSEAVTISGKNYTINWSVATVDLDSDGIPEPNAKTITVSLSGMSDRSLITLRVDHENKIGKIP